ncbi:acyl carrier protein [Paucidesulfovibrio longus]|uniref:acyl carrier protein n=1 Tax=Paucidesulfovibrio longus TaxID=889 RepID=UPI0003B742ED|nr:phosphopantetheine-binding protein [Paucidesulfovibrio longus]
MTEQEIIRTVNDALAAEFELDPAKLVPTANFNPDLGLDSLDAVDMVIVLEQAFGFKIRQDESIQSIRTLGDLHQFVIAKKNTVETAPAELTEVS